LYNDNSISQKQKRNIMNLTIILEPSDEGGFTALGSGTK